MFAAILLTICTTFDEPPLTTAQSVRALHPEEIDGRTAKLIGVVTHVNPHLPDFFLHDETAGIYVGISKLSAGLAQGDRVEVEGKVSAGSFAPYVKPTAIRKLGAAPLPDPEPFSLRARASRWLDGQYVQTYAFARAVSARSGYAILSVVTAEGVGAVFVPGEAHLDALRMHVGKTIRIRGVCVPSHDEKRQIRGVAIVFVQTPDGIKGTPGPQPRLVPAPLAQHVKGFSAVPAATAQPIVLEAVATAQINARELLLQDDTGGAHVVLAEPGQVKVGEKITVNGFLFVESTGVRLENAAVMKAEPGTMPAPKPAGVPLFCKKNFGCIIQVDGVVDETATRDQSFLVNLRNGPDRFQAVLRGKPSSTAIERIVPDATVRVTGVEFTFPDGKPEPEPPIVLLRDEGDLDVIAPPPPPPSFWTTGRVAAVVAGCAAIVLLVGVWAWLLRRQVRKQTELIAANFQREANLNESLRQARKLEAVGRLAGGIAHDFNNLLTVIIGNSELAARSIKQGDPARELVASVCDAAEKAAGMTRQLLTFSRHGPVNLQAIDLNAALKEVEALLPRLIGGHIRLVMQPTPGLPPVMGESSLIHQILFNLAANARDAMPHGGELTIGTSLATNERGEKVVRLTVADNGVGMDEATKARVFEPFFTTKEVGRGTGLGLATVYGTLGILNGHVTIESTPGRGATFLVDFVPLVDAPPPASDPSIDLPQTRDACILLVDDDDTVRDVCKRGLELYGYRVLDANSSRAALELANAAFDLVVTDLVMPEMNGHELAIRLRALRPDLKILFISGYPEDEVGRFVDLKDVEILSKPFTPMHLAVKVQDMLEEKSSQPQAAYQATAKPSRLPT